MNILVKIFLGVFVVSVIAGPLVAIFLLSREPETTTTAPRVGGGGMIPITTKPPGDEEPTTPEDTTTSTDDDTTAATEEDTKPVDTTKTVVQVKEKHKTFTGEKDAMVSPNGKFKLTFTNPQLLLVNTESGELIWNTWKYDGCNSDVRMDFQTDGNVVLYCNGKAVWASNTDWGNKENGYQLELHNDGSIVWKTGSTVVWKPNLKIVPGRNYSIILKGYDRQPWPNLKYMPVMFLNDTTFGLDKWTIVGGFFGEGYRLFLPSKGGYVGRDTSRDFAVYTARFKLVYDKNQALEFVFIPKGEYTLIQAKGVDGFFGVQQDQSDLKNRELTLVSGSFSDNVYEWKLNQMGSVVSGGAVVIASEKSKAIGY